MPCHSAYTRISTSETNERSKWVSYHLPTQGEFHDMMKSYDESIYDILITVSWGPCKPSLPDDRARNRYEHSGPPCYVR